MRLRFPIAGTIFCLCLVLVVRAAETIIIPSKVTPPIKLEVGVDSRVELISLIFRFAGNPEYQQGRVKSYQQDSDAHFRAHRDHPVIKLARDLRARRGVSYDAPMSLAVHVQDAETLKERVPFEPRPEGLDNRWQRLEVGEFLTQTRDFMQTSKFTEFTKAHQAFYDETTAKVRSLVEKEGNLEWFSKFFGERAGAIFRLVPALVNGGSCYGPHFLHGQEAEFYCILGVWQVDADGKPVFDRGMLDTVAHEFCHSYVNPHIYSRTVELEVAGKSLYATVRARMQRMAYGNWQTMLHESVVRAAVVRYLDATQGHLAAAQQVRQEIQRGFGWMKELATLLETYEKQRDKYPTFDTFMPEIVAFFKQTATAVAETK